MKLTKLIRQFARYATQTPRARRRVVRRTSMRVDEHFADPSRRDGRGRSAKELRRAEKALRHLNRAVVWQHRRDLDPNVRREARALVQAACHGRMPFEALMRRASKLRGRVNRSGKVRNDRMPIRGCRRLRKALPQDFVVECLHTVERLAKAGRWFGNCAKDNGYGLHDALRRRRSDFYWMQRGSEPVAMFEVALKAGKITEFLGRRNSDIELPRTVLVAMLRQLRLNGDHVDACLRQGAASIFATGSADPEQPHWRRKRLKVWYAAGRLVLCEGRREQWSSFEWDGEWEASDASRRQRLDDLMTRHPSLAKLARRAVTDMR